MIETNKTNDDASQVDSSTGDIGGVQTAGETTAAAAISGPANTKPVGSDTLVKVADTSDASENARTDS